MSIGKSFGATFLAVFVLTACGEYAPTGLVGGPLSAGSGTGSVKEQHPIILFYDSGISTTGVTIPAGTAVEWRNASSVGHSVSNYSAHPQSEVWDDAFLPPGEDFSYLFDRPGEYGFVCIYHQDVGYITVLPADDMDMDMNMDMNMDGMSMMP